MFYNILKREHKMLVLTKVSSDTPILYSYSRIPMSDEQIINLLSWLEERGVDNAKSRFEIGLDIVIDPKEYPEVLKSFFSKITIAKEKGQYEEVPNKVLDCPIIGTSALLRNSERTAIRIVRRKDNKTKLNKVCISNGIREAFFNDSKAAHGIPVNGNYSLFVEDGDIFQYWSNLMDSIYFDLLDRTKSDKVVKQTSGIFICQVDSRLSLPQAKNYSLCKGCKNAKYCWGKENKEYLRKNYFID